MARLPVRLTLLAFLIVSLPAAAAEPAPAVDLFGDPLPPGAVARLGTLRFRASHGIKHLAFSPDGKRLVAQSLDAISVWDAESGRKQIEFAGQSVGPLAWRTDGSGVMLIHDESGSIRFGDFTGETLPKLSPNSNDGMIRPVPQMNAAEDDERIHTYAISPGGKYLLAGRTGNHERDRSVTVWELEPGRTLADLRRLRELGPQKGTCLQIVFSPDGTHAGVLSGPASAVLVRANVPLTESISFALYDLSTGKESDRRTIVMPSVRGGKLIAALATGGRYLAVGGNDAICHIYKLGRDGSEVTYGPRYQPRSFFSGWTSMAFAGDYVVAADGMIGRLYCLTAKTAFEETPAPSGIGFVEALAVSPDGKRSATAGHSGVIRLWDIANGREIESAAGHFGAISNVQIAADGSRVLTWGTSRRDVISVAAIGSREHDFQPRLWEMATGKELRRFSTASSADSIAVTPDHKTLLAKFSNDGMIRSLDVATGVKRPMPADMGVNRGFPQSQPGDGRSVVVVNGLDVGIWDWPDGSLRRSIDVKKEPQDPRAEKGLHAWLAPDGKRLITRRLPGGVDVWDAESGEHRSRLISTDLFGILAKVRDFGKIVEYRADRGIAFLNRGQHLAYLENLPEARTDTTEARRLTLWNLETGKLLRTFEPSGSFWSRDIAADPRGYTLATAEDGRLDKGFTLLYEVVSGQIRRRLDGHISVHTSVAFSPDGGRLVTVSGDSTGLVWDMILKSAARGQMPASEADLERAWNALAQPSAPAAYRALIVFAGNPEGAIELLRKRLHAVARLDGAVLDRIVNDLESDKFAVRDWATNELEKLGRTAASAIRVRAAKVQSLETKRRLAQYLERHESGPFSAEEIRAIRALEFLEQTGTPAARAMIAELAKGEPAADRTIYAIAAKDRLDRRKN